MHWKWKLFGEIDMQHLKKAIVCIRLFIGLWALYIFSLGENLQAADTTLPNPLGSATTPEAVIGRVIRAMLGFVGLLSLFAFVYAGAMFVASQGNSERVQKARDIMLYSVIGIAVALGSYVILSFVIDTLVKGVI